MSHEQSETIERDGNWINVYGQATPQAGQQLPNSGVYKTVEEAVAAAKARSESAGNLLGLRMDPNNPNAQSMQPPDALSAGAMSAQGAPLSVAGLLDAMRSRGSMMNPAALAGLMSPPNPFVAAASAVNSPRGTNPYLAQHAEQSLGLMRMYQQNQQYQQGLMMQEAELRSREAQAQLERQARREQSLLEINKGLLGHPSKEARMVGASGLASFLKANKQPVPDGLIAELIMQNVKTSDINDIQLRMHQGWTDERIQAVHPNIPLPVIQDTRLTYKNPAVINALHLKSQAELDKDVANAKEAEAKAIFAKYGPMPTEMAFLVTAAHSKVFKKPFGEGTTQTQDAAIAAATEEYERRRDLKESQEAQRLALRERADKRMEEMAQLNMGILQRMTGGVGSTAPVAGAGGATPGPLNPAAGAIGGRSLPGFEVGFNIGPSGPRVLLTPQKETLKNLGELEQTGSVLEHLDQLSSRLITAKSAPEAVTQAAKLHFGAFSGSNADARTYQETRDGALSLVAKNLMRESGVLSNQDIARVGRLFPSFSDTDRVRVLKMGFLKDLFGTTQEVQEAIYLGKPINKGAYRAKILKRLDQTEGAIGEPARASGPSIPQTGTRPTITRQQFDALRQGGISQKDIEDKYAVTP